MNVRKTRTSRLLAMSLLFAFSTYCSVSLLAQSGVPYPDVSNPKPVDLGPLVGQAGSTPIAVTVALRLRSPNEAESLMKALHTPGDSQFHRFLSPAEFAARFVTAPADVAKADFELAIHNSTQGGTDKHDDHPGDRLSASL